MRAGEATIASMLKEAGYATGGFGKWGCGGRGSTGVPEEHGFDDFVGYYDQVHAHSFYPPYLVRNSEEVPLEGNIGGRSGETYSHYSIMEAGLDFIRENRDRPFFAYFPITPPHGMYDIPDDDLESLHRWDNYTKAKEAMFFYTDTADAPWTIIKSDDKKRARLECLRFFLHSLDYPDKDTEIARVPDPKIVVSPSAVFEKSDHPLDDLAP